MVLLATVKGKSNLFILLLVSRPRAGKASRSETRHERVKRGGHFQEEGADGIGLYNTLAVDDTRPDLLDAGVWHIVDLAIGREYGISWVRTLG
ncbi:hypothetical protein F5883DRAFT_249445 [Diaporthe sp. PMI_573]|jgi:hypothetical protein|nr:hypothetical protein F5883DRAFT_249445 [Diaporthaceae sp. PMI_573]